GRGVRGLVPVFINTATYAPSAAASAARSEAEAMPRPVPGLAGLCITSYASACVRPASRRGRINEHGYSVFREGQRLLQPFGKLPRRASSPEVEEYGPGLLPGHVVVDGDDLDAGRAERLQHALELSLSHREIPVHARVGVAPGKRHPGVHPEVVGHFDAVVRGLAPDRDLEHVPRRLPLVADERLDRRRVE